MGARVVATGVVLVLLLAGLLWQLEGALGPAAVEPSSAPANGDAQGAPLSPASVDVASDARAGAASADPGAAARVPHETLQVDAPGVAGLVLDDRGEPVPGAWVQLRLPPDERPCRVLADEQGSFRAPLRAPELVLEAGAVGHVGFGPETLCLDATGALDIVLTREASLEARFHDPDRSLGPEPLILAWHGRSGTLRSPHSVESRPDSSWRLRFSLQPGLWHVLALRDTHDVRGLREQAQAGVDPRHDLTRRGVAVVLGPGESRDVDVPVPASRVLAGRVHDRGVGVPDVHVRAGHRTGVTDADGRFRLADPRPGVYEVSALRRGEPRARRVIVDVPVDADVVADIPFEGHVLRLQVVDVTSGAGIEGARLHVLLDDGLHGTLLPAGQQVASSVDRRGAWIATSDATGLAEIPWMSAGTYWVWAEAAPGWLPDDAVAVEVGPGLPLITVPVRRGVGLSLSLGRGGAEQLEPLSSVSLRPRLLHPPASLRSGREPVWMDIDLHRTPRGQGPFTALALRPGEYALHVRGEFGERSWPLRIPDLPGTLHSVSVP